MAEMLENGNPLLGRYLDDSSHGGISPDTILLSTSLEEIQIVARNLKIKKKLYAEYWKEKEKFGVN
jgi:hypothetical protein